MAGQPWNTTFQEMVLQYPMDKEPDSGWSGISGRSVFARTIPSSSPSRTQSKLPIVYSIRQKTF